MILVCYVDDIIAFSLKSQELEWLEESFAKQTNEYDSFEFTVGGEVAAYLGIEVSYEANGAIHLKQPYLINHICEAVGALEDQKRHDTPADRQPIATNRHQLLVSRGHAQLFGWHF
jgi:hypothetical protein